MGPPGSHISKCPNELLLSPDWAESSTETRKPGPHLCQAFSGQALSLALLSLISCAN